MSDYMEQAIFSLLLQEQFKSTEGFKLSDDMFRFAFLKCHPGYLLDSASEVSARCHKAFGSHRKKISLFSDFMHTQIVSD